MTQKEYQEKIQEYKKRLAELEEKLRQAENKNYNYEELLYRYYETNEELKREREGNRLNCNTIYNQKTLIEQYEKILSRITINEE